MADWAILFRPFYWGYLFLSIGKGMAFWCGRYIALFLVSFEFGMLLTEKKKGLSVICFYDVICAGCSMVVCNQWICGNADIFSIIHFAALLLHENRKAMAENFMSGRYYDFSRRFYIDNISCMADSNGIFDSRCWNLGNSQRIIKNAECKSGTG